VHLVAHFKENELSAFDVSLVVLPNPTRQTVCRAIVYEYKFTKIADRAQVPWQGFLQLPQSVPAGLAEADGLLHFIPDPDGIDPLIEIDPLTERTRIFPSAFGSQKQTCSRPWTTGLPQEDIFTDLDPWQDQAA
jgi:hypothetical protein